MIHLTAKVSEEVNRKCRTRNTTVQPSTPYTDPKRQTARRHRQRDRRTGRRHHRHAKSPS